MTVSADRVRDVSGADVAPAELGVETASALATVHARGEAFNARDLERMVALSSGDCELAEATDGVALFDVEEGRVRRFRPQPDLDSAFRAAGWS